MPRSLWNGTIAFGAVAVPVKLYSAVKPQTVHFHEVHLEDGARIEHRPFCAKEDKEVAREEVVKGYELASGRYVVLDKEEIGHGYELDSGKQVVLTDAELEAVAPRRTRTIEIDAFVDADELDPILFDHPYWLVPTGEAAGPKRAYRLLVDAMEDAERLALGRFVLRSKEYLVAVRARDGLLALTTMLFADEVRPTKDIDNGGRKPSKRALDEAVKLIKALSQDFDPTDYADEHRERLLAVIADKKKERTIEAPE